MKARLSGVEQLEDRCVPATYGNPWPDGMHLTLSFAPDGTLIGSQPSFLQALLNAQASTPTWQLEILRAFQTWAVNANLNIGLVADGGQAFGSPGRAQGDDRFGDIRIGGSQNGADDLAIASPFQADGGTWSGDVELNTAVPWSIGGQNNTIDLFSALLHEAGHVFGMDHNPDPASVLYANYLGVRTGLAASDIANLQALYGARSSDRYEGLAGNNTQSTATPLSFLTNPDGSLGVAVDADITTLSDKDFFRVQAPLNVGSMYINFKTAGLSLLTARVTVYDASGHVVASSAAADPLHNDLSLRINSPTPLGTYYVKVESATGNVFGIGSYHLEVKSLSVVQTLTGTVSGTTSMVVGLLNNDLHTNDSFLTAALLPALTSQVNSRFDYGFSGSISDSWDFDYYRIRAPQNTTGTETVMSAMVWGLENNGLLPRLSVYDAQANPVNADVLVNADGNFIVQVRNAVPGADYYVKVEAASNQGPNNTGNYFLGVDFSSQAVQLNSYTSGTLNASKSRTGGMLSIGQSQMLHLVLSASGSAGMVRMTISDMSGHVITTLTATSGKDPVSLTQGLTQGYYLIRFEAFTADGSALGSVNYSLTGSKLSDPIGPRNDDSTTTTTSSPPPSDTSYSSPSSSTTTTDTSTSSTTTTDTSSSSTTTTSSTAPPPRPDGMTDEEYAYYCEYYWDSSSSSSGTTSTDPYSDPYTAS